MQTECGKQLILLAGLSLMGITLIGLSIESVESSLMPMQARMASQMQ